MTWAFQPLLPGAAQQQAGGGVLEVVAETGGGRHRKPWSPLDLYGPDPGPIVSLAQSQEGRAPEAVSAALRCVESDGDSFAANGVVLVSVRLRAMESESDAVHVYAVVRAGWDEIARQTAVVLFNMAA